MVHVDETTYRKLRHGYDFDEPQTLYLKGKGNTIVYRIVGRKSTRSPTQEASIAG